MSNLAKRSEELSQLATAVADAQAELDSLYKSSPFANIVLQQKGVDLLAAEAADARRFQMATTKYQTAFTRYMSALNQEAAERSAAETQAIRLATVWMMVFTAVIAVATVVGVIVALVKH